MATDTAFDPADFHERAVRTPSHEDIGEMRDLLVDTLADHGTDPSVDEAGNIRATREGTKPGPHLVLNTHIDTVPPHIPYSRDGDIVRGRGACDAKGPLTALVDAFLESKIAHGRVSLAVTPDEETRSTGAASLAGDLDADGYVVGEPTGLDVCNAAKGRFEGTVEIQGEAAHAAEPDSGLNAIRAAAVAVQAMETFDKERGPGAHPDLGRPTLTATTIEGGHTRNQVPAECRIGFDRRSVPPETANGFRVALEEHCYQWMPRGMDLRVSLMDRPTPFLEAFATPADEPLVETLAEAAGGTVRPFAAATEASYFTVDAPTVVFGPGVLADGEGAVAHSEREYVRLSDVRAAADAVGETLAAFVG